MKMQNVLASKSTGDMAYLCGKCGKEVDKEAVVCPKCHAKLGGIRCPFCNFSGTTADFKNDTCPKCGRKNNSRNNKPVSSQKYSRAQNKISHLSGKMFIILLIILLFTSITVFFAILFYFDIM